MLVLKQATGLACIMVDKKNKQANNAVLYDVGIRRIEIERVIGIKLDCLIELKVKQSFYD